MLPIRYVFLLVCCCLTSGRAVAQERSAPAYVQQGLQSEKTGDYRSALAAYRKALPVALPEDQRVIEKAIDRVEDLLQQQMLVNGARADDIKRSIQALSDPQIRRRLLEDLADLEASGNPSVADFQNMTRRVEAAKRVETALNTHNQESQRAAKSTHTARPRQAARPPAQAPIIPPKKTVVVDLPGADAFRGNQTNKSVKPKP